MRWPTSPALPTVLRDVALPHLPSRCPAAKHSKQKPSCLWISSLPTKSRHTPAANPSFRTRPRTHRRPSPLAEADSTYSTRALYPRAHPIYDRDGGIASLERCVSASHHRAASAGAAPSTSIRANRSPRVPKTPFWPKQAGSHIIETSRHDSDIGPDGQYVRNDLCRRRDLRTR